VDIRTQLLVGHSRENADRIARHVGDDPERFAVLMGLMLNDADMRVRQLAAHSVSVVGEANPELATPYVKQLLAVIEQPVHEGVQRTAVRAMQSCTLPKALHGRITQVMFALVADPARPIAQRAFAIAVAHRMVQVHPELGVELRLVLEDVLRVDPGPAVRSRATKVLKALGGRRPALD
jgi:hypothetical protein